ncbi:MFS transporter [Actinoplanes sp. NPDC051494]|uniref:MFS transporter n=1 Tax=Actinoplanes sp. NPDC051494 TaxID=3363907 RepID=UPI0037BBCE07
MTTSYRWVILAAATFTQAAAAFFVQGLGALGVHLQRELHLSAAQLGLLVSAAQLVPLAGLLVAGELLDRFDERWVVGAGAGLVGGALLAGTFAPGYAALLAVLLVVGAGYSTVQPGGSKSVASWFGTAQRGTAMGVRQAGLPLGAALAAAVLPATAAAFGWRATLTVGGVVALLGAAVFMGLYRRPPQPAATPATPDGATPDGATPHRAGPDRAGPDRASRRALLKDPVLRTALLCGVSLISVHSGLGLLAVLHLHEVAALTPGRAATIVVVAQLAGAAGRILLAAYSDRVRAGRVRAGRVRAGRVRGGWARSGRQGVVTASMLAVVAALAVLVTPWGAVPMVAGAAFVWLGFFGIGWYGPWVTLVTEAAPAGRTGFALGLVMAAGQIAVVLAPPVLGLLRDGSGGFAAPWGLLIVLTCGALLGTVRIGRPDRTVQMTDGDRCH